MKYFEFKNLLTILIAVAFVLGTMGEDAIAHEKKVVAQPPVAAQGNVQGDRYKPALGITPDGCQVWMIDDGVEGYAWNRTDRDGKPVCVEVELCFIENSNTLFNTDSARIRASEMGRLTEFFQQRGVYSYAINGYTDARASQEYNLRLGKRRAAAVARVARAAGARVAAVRSYGESYPVATNASVAGLQANRRVEIVCYRDIGEY